jgi:hypothetical protein
MVLIISQSNCFIGKPNITTSNSGSGCGAVAAEPEYDTLLLTYVTLRELN